MIERAMVLGELGRAVFVEDGRYFAVSVQDEAPPVPCRPGDVSLLLDSRVEVEEVLSENVDVKSLRSTLKGAYVRHNALSLALSGMDPDLKVSTRSLCIEAAEELVGDTAALNFVRARLLSRALPEATDITTAIRQAKMVEARRLAAIYEDVEQFQPIIHGLCATWEEVSGEFFDSVDEAASAERVLINAGVFSGMISAIGAGKKADLNLVFVTFARNADLNRRVPRCSMLLNRVRTHLLEHHVDLAPVGSSVAQESDVGDDETGDASVDEDPIREIIFAIRDGRYVSSGKKVLNSFEAKQRTDRQIDAIRKALGQGRLDRFDGFLLDLIKFQADHSEPQHLAMTLCSLSKSALISHRPEIATRLVGYAFDLQVEDAVIWTTRAEVFRAADHLLEALAAYDATVARFPDDVVAQNGRAEVLREMRRLSEALAAYDATAERFPDNVFAPNGRAEVLREMGRLLEALAAYDTTIVRFPDDVVAQSGRAEVLREMGRLPEALAAYDTTVSRFPGDVVAQNGRAEVLREMGRLPEALEAYDAIAAHFPDNVFARTGRAEVLREMGRLPEALEAYDATAARFPDNVVARNGRAEVLREMGRLPEALEAYDATAARFPDNVVAQTGRAEVLKEMGRLPEALEAYDATAARFPDNVFARTGRAEVLKGMGRLPEALEAYDATAARFPDNVVVRSGRAEVLREMGRLEEALAAYEEAAKQFPIDAVVRNGRATLMLLLDKIAAARVILPDGEIMTEEDWIGFHILAMSYLKSDRQEDLNEALRRLEIGSREAPWPRVRQYYDTALAVALMRKKEFERAAEMLEAQVREQQPNAADLARQQLCMVLLAHSQAALERRAEALNSLAGVSNTVNPEFGTLKTALISYYGLVPTTGVSGAKPVRDNSLLQDIEQREFRLALAT